MEGESNEHSGNYWLNTARITNRLPSGINHNHHWREAAMMNRRLGRIGIVRRELVGKACSSCGGRTYQLTYHGSTSPMAGLAARCTHCQQARRLGEDLGRVLWV
jgi:hypothetical protein